MRYTYICMCKQVGECRRVLTGAGHFLLAYRFNFSPKKQTERGKNFPPTALSFIHLLSRDLHSLSPIRPGLSAELQHVKIHDSHELAESRDREFCHFFFCNILFLAMICALKLGKNFEKIVASVGDIKIKLKCESITGKSWKFNEIRVSGLMSKGAKGIAVQFNWPSVAVFIFMHFPPDSDIYSEWYISHMCKLLADTSHTA